jgi:hypothetical protein
MNSRSTPKNRKKKEDHDQQQEKGTISVDVER